MFLFLFYFLFCGIAFAQEGISQLRFYLYDRDLLQNIITDTSTNYDVFLFDTKNKIRIDSLKYGSKQYYKKYQFYWYAELPADDRLMALTLIRKTTNDTMTIYYKAKEGMNCLCSDLPFIPGYFKTDYRVEYDRRREYSSLDSGKIVYDLMFSRSEKNYWEKDTLHKCECEYGLDWRTDSLGVKRAYVEGTNNLFTGICWGGNTFSYVFKNGLRDPNYTEYYPSGKIKSKVNGDGTTEYYENGQFKFGFVRGERIEYYENGKIESPVTIKSNKRCTKSISYYEDGSKKSKYTNRNKRLRDVHFDHSKKWDEKGKKVFNEFERSRSWRTGETYWGRTITLTLREDGKIKFRIKVYKGGKNIFP